MPVSTFSDKLRITGNGPHGPHGWQVRFPYLSAAVQITLGSVKLSSSKWVSFPLIPYRMGLPHNHIIIIITIIITYLLQLSFHSVAVVLTLVQTKQIIHINETIQKHSTNNTKHSKYKYTLNLIFLMTYHNLHIQHLKRSS